MLRCTVEQGGTAECTEAAANRLSGSFREMFYLLCAEQGLTLEQSSSFLFRRSWFTHEEPAVVGAKATKPLR